ncbi:MAG: zinc ribbon domain-containing protein [Armatimonadetes bacterium]|nr:zinc ribbon domain-containing protein [Armatimonadota bacterium]
MPIYEFRCKDCGAKVALLMGMTSEPDEEVCPKCGSRNLGRLVSRFRKGRTEDDRVDELADRLEVMGEPDSANEMRGLVREMGKAMDEDFSDEMEELFESDMEEDAPADD